MSLLVVLGALVVLCLTALVAAGIGEGLADAEPDRSPRGQLPEGAVTANDVRSLRFSLAFRGYRMTEVDAALARLAAQLEAHGPGPTQQHVESPPPEAL